MEENLTSTPTNHRMKYEDLISERLCMQRQHVIKDDTSNNVYVEQSITCIHNYIISSGGHLKPEFSLGYAVRTKSLRLRTGDRRYNRTLTTKKFSKIPPVSLTLRNIMCK